MRALILGILLLVPPLAGCFAPSATDSVELARPRIGDHAEYAVSGHLIEFSRWANGIPIFSEGARLALSLEGADDLALDGFRARHEVFRVTEALAEGSAFALHREFLVSPAHAAVVQGFAPLASEDVVVSFDERGYPWAWGASLLHGERLAPGAAVDFELPANGGQPGPLRMRLVVGEPERVGERDAYRVRIAEPEGAEWTLWLAPEVPYPVRVDITLGPEAWDPFVRVDDKGSGPLTFRADLVSFERGATPIPPRDSSREWLDEPTSAVFETWDREVPPDGDAYSPFLLRDAVEWAKTFDTGFSAWYDARPGAILYRATHHARPGPAEGTVTLVWLVQYVSPDDEYYEIQVDRTYASGVPAVPLVTTSTISRTAEPPGGDHGWFETSGLPSRILGVSSGIDIVRALFEPDGVEVFIRSYVDPDGYSYFLDGGFEEPQGRYTVIVNAQTGFVQAAVGPVAPVTERAG